jgi:acetate---CoA ligase (ADP-forming)
MVTRTPPAALPPSQPVILRDGSTAVMRPARADDVNRLQALFDRASRESLWMRFFTPRPSVDRTLVERLAEIDGVERMSLLILRGEGAEERVIAVGSYPRLPRWDTAEVAFFVDDAFQGKGLGTLLLEHLAEHARRNGVLSLVADVLPDNHRMLSVFRKSGFTLNIEHEKGVVHIRLPASADETARAESEARLKIATAASLVPFFRPRSVAVIGASRQERSIGRTVLERLLGASFEGPVYPVNPTARSVAARG